MEKEEMARWNNKHEWPKKYRREKLSDLVGLGEGENRKGRKGEERKEEKNEEVEEKS